VSVRTAGAGELARCLGIAEALPDYFSASGLAILSADLQRHVVLVSVRDDAIDGFITLDKKSDAVQEIGWLAVDPKAQSDGLGSQLIEAAERSACDAGAALLEVKTLAPKEGAANYDGTRRFYERHGFACVEIIDPFPGWDPGNPCAIYVKGLS
jgi:GNAT superfamily N-acetyltransferase